MTNIDPEGLERRGGVGRRNEEEALLEHLLLWLVDLCIDKCIL